MKEAAMKWVLLSIAIVVVLVGIVAIVGALLPKAHSATRSARYQQPPETVWREITDIEAFPSWREGLKSVERLPDRDGRPAWRETDSRGQVIPLQIVESDPPRKLVTRIADPKLPFGGTWTYEIAPAGSGSVVTLTERGEIYNPIFRFVARFLIGYTGTIETYLRSLGMKFGEGVHFEQQGGS
jgi:uncharacterized protein YndB with AHSA1/START domain